MKKVTFLILTAILFLASRSFAYGPFYTYPENTGGDSYRWQNGKMIWYYDEGPLSKKVPLKSNSACDASQDPCSSAMVNCGVLACVEKSFKEWNDASLITMDGDGAKKSVKAVNMNIIAGGKAGMDINGGNWYSLYQRLAALTTNKNPIAYIIFDKDGEILQDLWGDDNSLPLGLTLLIKNSSSKYYNAGMVIYNGLAFDGEDDDSVSEVDSAKEFAATIIHELGHLLGLDHTQPLRSTLGDDEYDTPSYPTGVPTMYPSNITENQAYLHVDDIAGLAYVYWNEVTTDDFKKSFCTIEGTLNDASDNKGYQGVNVLAYAHLSDDDTVELYADQRSFVSGSLYPPHTTNGSYKLIGLIPGVSYQVVYEAIMPAFQGTEETGFAGSINPYGIDEDDPFEGPTEDDFAQSSNPIASPSGLTYVGCDVKEDSDPKLAEAYSDNQSYTEVFEGTTVSMKASDAPKASETDDSDDDSSDSTTTKKGWFGCSLIRD